VPSERALVVCGVVRHPQVLRKLADA
jgi:hypothetical protein